MKAVFYPFFSQQNKLTRKFLLASDSGVKLYAYMARRLAEEGWDVEFVLPQEEQCESAFGVFGRVRRAPYALALNNLDRRLQWEPAWLRSLECDLLFTQHEFLAYPLRCLLPAQRIAMECGIRPTTAWSQTREVFPLAWRAANLVHCNSGTLAEEVSAYGARTAVWRFSYDGVLEEELERDVDVLFNARASATGYSNHGAFLQAFSGSKLRAKMTDPTSYLRNQGCTELLTEPLCTFQYKRLLKRTRVVVGLTANGYGGHAFVEAIAHGACPVALRTPEYVELLTPEWPYYCSLSDIAEVVEAALECGPDVPAIDAVRRNVAACSYAEAWKVARESIACLLA